MLKKCFVFVLVGMFLCCSQIYAQAPAPAAPAVPVRPPVMKSIFWNTVLGSAWGAVMGTAAALGSPNIPFRDSLILGTTMGGMVGYGFGVFLVIRGITFDPSTLPVPPTTPLGSTMPVPGKSIVQNEILPFSAEMKLPEQPSETHWQTTIFQMTF